MKLFKPADHVLIGTRGGWETTPGSRMAGSDFVITHFAGIALGAGGVTSCESLVHRPPILERADLVDASGEWVAIATATGEQENQYLVFSDPYGFAPVFYSFVPGSGVVVSESFQGAVAGLDALGVERELDVPHYLSMITLGFENMVSERTMAQQVRILPQDQCLHITADSVALRPRRDLGGAGSHDDYETVLSMGLQRVRKTMAGFAAMPDVAKVLTLSGGVDSRLALAMLRSAGVADLFETRTVDPRTWTAAVSKQSIQRDMAIADRLRRDHGMSLETPRQRTEYRLNFEETLGFHQSHRSNYNYNYAPRHHQSTLEPPVLVVRGGGGEILRATNGGIQRSRQFAERPDKDQNETDWLVAKHFALNPVLLPTFKPLVHEFLTEAFGRAEGNSFEERLNHDYLRTRNRSHFGHIRQGAVGNEISIHLVADAYFLRASSLIPFEEKSVGRLVRDLYELAPELRRYPFESEEWNQRLGVFPQVEVDFAGEPWAADLDANARLRSTVANRREDRWASGPGRLKEFDAKRSSINYIKYGFSEILDRVGPEVRQDLAAQHTKLLTLVTADEPVRGRVLAKLASALDAFHPPTMAGAAVRLSTSDRAPELPRSTMNVLSSTRARGFPVPEQNPQLSLDPSGFVIDSHPGPDGITHELEFAFYLFRDGQRVESRWYEDSPTMRFSHDVLPGSYSATSFMRRRGRETPTWVDRTDYVRVDQAAEPVEDTTPPTTDGRRPRRAANWIRRRIRLLLGPVRRRG